MLHPSMRQRSTSSAALNTFLQMKSHKQTSMFEQLDTEMHEQDKEFYKSLSQQPYVELQDVSKLRAVNRHGVNRDDPNLMWRACLNDDAVQREVTIYNFVMTHSDAPRKGDLLGSQSMKHGTFAKEYFSRDFKAVFSGRHILRLVGNDQRFVPEEVNSKELERAAGKTKTSPQKMYRVVPFLISERYQCTLYEALRQSPDAGTVKRWCLEVFQQLKELHKIGVLHNLTNPDCVVLRPRRAAKGFGARSTKSNTIDDPLEDLEALLMNFSCATMFHPDKLKKLARSTMLQHRADPMESPFHKLPVEMYPSRVFAIPPEWEQEGLGMAKEPGSSGVRFSEILLESPIAASSQPLSPSLRPSTAHVGVSAIKKESEVSLHRLVLPHFVSRVCIYPTEQADSYLAGKLLSYAFSHYDDTEAIAAQQAAARERRRDRRYSFGRRLSDLKPDPADALADVTPWGFRCSYPGMEAVGEPELHHLIVSLTHRDPNRRWLVSDALCHPTLWNPGTICEFFTAVLDFISTVQIRIRSATVMPLIKRPRRGVLSSSLREYITLRTKWMTIVHDWYHAMCQDNIEGVRYDYENSLEDQLQFFLNVYSHISRHRTQAICDGDPNRMALCFVNRRFPGMVLSLAQRMVQVPEDAERFIGILAKRCGASLSSLELENSEAAATPYQVGENGELPGPYEVPRPGGGRDPFARSRTQESGQDVLAFMVKLHSDNRVKEAAAPKQPAARDEWILKAVAKATGGDKTEIPEKDVPPPAAPGSTTMPPTSPLIPPKSPLMLPSGMF